MKDRVPAYLSGLQCAGDKIKNFPIGIMPLRRIAQHAAIKKEHEMLCAAERAEILKNAFFGYRFRKNFPGYVRDEEINRWNRSILCLNAKVQKEIVFWTIRMLSRWICCAAF